MKEFKFIHVLLAVVFFFTACNDDFLEQPKTPAADGSEIIFGGRAGFENNGNDTRTVYTGDIYDYNGKNYERIDWIDGDKIEIYSSEASNGPSAHYNITSLTAGDENAGATQKGSDYAYLERQGESALRWNGDGNHTFYAMYPSTSMFVREDGTIPTVEQGIKLGKSENKIVVNGTVPTSQSGEITVDDDGNYTIAPNMKYAYMVAKTTANRKDNPNIGLSFVPIVTAVEIEMIVPENTEQNVHDVLIAEIQVTGNGIAGDFTADLTSWNTGYPTCANVGDGQGTIQISTWKDNKPLTLKEGKKLKFTVFMRPGADYNNLTISYSPTGSGYFRKKLFGTDSNNNAYNVNIPRNLKTRIKNLHLPATYEEPFTVDASRWMDQLADDAEFKALSIPGTGGTFSYKYNSRNPGWYKQQTIDFEAQWKLGIRAFEIVSNRPSSSSTSLGGEYVKCNKVSMEVTVSTVLKDLLAEVKGTATTDPVTNETIYNPTETAVLILTYQPEGNSPNRNGANYASSLKLLYNSLSEDQKAQIIQYTPGLTLGQARGKVMIFCRINQRDENDNGDTSDKTAFELATTTLDGTNITLIDGCGTGKDRWGARGYKVNGNVAYDAANTGDANKSVDYYLTQYDADDGWGQSLQWADWTKVSKPNAENGDLNFAFDTNYSGISCWYQEWARVVPGSIIDNSLGWYQVKNTGLGIADIYPDYRWYESYTEKVAAANKTFHMAISDEYPNYIFINSLCGYFVDKNIESSYTPFTGNNTGGIAGNIKGLADEINVDFYQHVLTSGFEQATGPTGIVMMDYAKNTPESETDGGYYLPGVIISNNFKGRLQTKPNGGTTGGGNTGGGSGTGSDEGEEEEG